MNIKPDIRTALFMMIGKFAASAEEKRSVVLERNLSVASPALEPSGGRRWPVMYLLESRPGLSDWLDQAHVTEVLDAAMTHGDIPPSLVVIAAAPFSWYVDDTQGQGDVATELTRDTRPPPAGRAAP